MKKTPTSILASIFLGGAVFLATACKEGSHDHSGHDHDHDHDHAPAPTALPPSPTSSPDGASLYIISPKDGAEVGSKFTVRFGLKGMGVAPAGVFVDGKATGHHHLVIDADTPNLKLPFPMDDKHLHFGGGQTEVELELSPGEHTLQLVLGDHNHVPHDPPLLSKKITVTVK